MKHYSSNEYSVSLSTTSTRLCGPNPRRHALLISHSPDVTFTVSNRNPAVASNGLVFNVGLLPRLLRYDDVGDWLRRDLYAVSHLGTGTIGVIDVSEEE